MTYEEAISILTKDRALCLFNPMTGDVEPLNEDCRMSAEALNIAIEALEKQIPKKPYDIVCCPLCKIEVELQPIDTEQVTYCLHCGQAIDWSDDK